MPVSSHAVAQQFTKRQRQEGNVERIPEAWSGLQNSLNFAARLCSCKLAHPQTVEVRVRARVISAYWDIEACKGMHNKLTASTLRMLLDE